MGEKHLAVLATDAVTRNNTQLTVGGLYEAMRARWQRGVPNTVSHDATRPIGWTWPFAIHVEPGLVRLIGVTELCEDDAEWDRLLVRYSAYLEERNEYDTRDHAARLRELLAEHLDGTETIEDITVAAMVGPNLARRVFSDLFELEDGEGLIPITALCPSEDILAPGVYRRGELAVIAHPYFRRSFTHQNNLNHDLLRALEVTATTKGATVRVRLDPDVVGLASSFLTPIELQYWYGPKFSDDVTQIAPGITRHVASDRERWFHAISRTEFWWQSRDGEHILEAEEIRDVPTLGKKGVTYGCRYVHSMVKEIDGTIHHLDGAVREYTEEAMITRLEQDIATAGRRSIYTKLWRVDGQITISSLKTLVHHHFRDNSLVAEYLEGSDATVVDDAIGASTEKQAPKSRLVPYSMRSGEGVQLLLSYRPVQENSLSAAGRVLVPWEHRDADGAVRPCIPSDVLELRKVLWRSGESLSLPAEWGIIGYGDLYINFPLIRHATRSALEGTLTAFRLLVTTWKTLGHDRCVAVNVSLACKECETTLSIAGHVNDVHDWLNRSVPFPPDDMTEHGSWLEASVQAMPQRGRDRDARPELALLNHAGILLFERDPLPRSDYELVPSDGGLMVKLLVNATDRELMQSAALGDMTVKLAYLIKASRCSKCGREYRECPCIKLVDEGVTRRIESMSILFAFWTDRPADSTPPPIVLRDPNEATSADA